MHGRTAQGAGRSRAPAIAKARGRRDDEAYESWKIAPPDRRVGLPEGQWPRLGPFGGRQVCAGGDPGGRRPAGDHPRLRARVRRGGGHDRGARSAARHDGWASADRQPFQRRAASLRGRAESCGHGARCGARRDDPAADPARDRPRRAGVRDLPRRAGSERGAGRHPAPAGARGAGPARPSLAQDAGYRRQLFAVARHRDRRKRPAAPPDRRAHGDGELAARPGRRSTRAACPRRGVRRRRPGRGLHRARRAGLHLGAAVASRASRAREPDLDEAVRRLLRGLPRARARRLGLSLRAAAE